MSLAGFKSIREMCDLDFKPLNVLIGANGAGKSNLISFFKLLNFAMTNSLKEYVARAGYANSLSISARSRPSRFRPHCHFARMEASTATK